MSRTLGPGPWCGTAGGYNNHNCRCDACTEAKRRGRIMSRTLGPGPWCGTAGGYNNHNCRCDACTEAKRIHQSDYLAAHPEQVEKKRVREAARRLRLGMVPRSSRVVDERCPVGFGSSSGYTNHGCRCPHCKAAHARYARELRARSALRATPGADAGADGGHSLTAGQSPQSRGRGGPPAVPATLHAPPSAPNGPVRPRSVELAGSCSPQLPAGVTRQGGARS